MASTTPKTILLNGEPQAESRQFEDMKTTSSVLTPGYFVEMKAATEQMVLHSTEGQLKAGLVVLENPFADTSGKAIDYNWDANSYPKYIIVRPGDKVYGWIEADATIDKGDPVESAGDGTVQEMTDTNGASLIGYAMDDITSTTGAKQRLTIRIA